VSSDNGHDDTGDGTQGNPFASITHAIGASSGKNIYVCAGASNYNEQILVNATTDGLRIYGGFDCNDWSYKTDRNSSVVSPEPIALRIQGLKKGIYIENVWFQAADGNDKSVAGASSYGAYVTGSKGVVFKRVKLMSGVGAKGADQVAAAKGDNGLEAGAAQKGSDGTCSTPQTAPTGGSWGNAASCSTGGDGGPGKKGIANGLPGVAGIPNTHVEAGDIENGGPGATGIGAGENGKDGKTGLAGNPGGAAGASGTFLVGGFTPAGGNTGIVGWPGQGGGGGGASKGTDACYGASGGAGGMGGCGGHPGIGGGGGGASVGLIAWGSELSLIDCTVVAGAGGAGGKGGDGGAGGLGAAGGAFGKADAGNVARGGQGGPGGNGGPGGSGSGGSGGPSYAIAWSGTAPTHGDDTTLTATGGGAKGAGGKGAPAGSDGPAMAEAPL
jgi:hypothetical protein